MFFVFFYKFGSYAEFMTQTIKDRTIERTCLNCGKSEQLKVSKKNAAFGLVGINKEFGNVCKNCPSWSFTISYQGAGLDFDLLKEWAISPDLYMMPQDEELMLADERYLAIILQVLDTVPISHHKQNVLLDTLCILVYDNSVDNPQKDEKLKNQVIEELNKREDKLKLADDWIMDYIKKVVYPQLTLV